MTTRALTTRERAAFACYALPALALLGIGLRYLTASEFMPYHAEAMQRSWSELAPNQQALLLGLLRGTGAGLVGLGLTLLVLLAIPFRRGERWARLALPGFLLGAALLVLYGILTVVRGTTARPPWEAAPALAALALIGLALAPAGRARGDPS